MRGIMLRGFGGSNAAAINAAAGAAGLRANTGRRLALHPPEPPSICWGRSSKLGNASSSDQSHLARTCERRRLGGLEGGVWLSEQRDAEQGHYDQGNDQAQQDESVTESCPASQSCAQIDGPATGEMGGAQAAEACEIHEGTLTCELNGSRPHAAKGRRNVDQLGARDGGPDATVDGKCDRACAPGGCVL
jgi:hypothetical protein